MHSIKVVAQLVEVILNDDEEYFSLFIKWGTNSQYICIAREENDKRIYCELYEQANGREFNLSLLNYSYSNMILTINMIPPGKFILGKEISVIEIDLSKVQYKEDELLICLKHLFRENK